MCGIIGTSQTWRTFGTAGTYGTFGTEGNHNTCRQFFTLGNCGFFGTFSTWMKDESNCQAQPKFFQISSFFPKFSICFPNFQFVS